MKSKKTWYKTYGIALLSVLAIWLIRMSLMPWLGAYAPLQPFLVAVMISAWVGGFGPALFAAVAGVTLGCYFFLVPFDSFTSTKLYHAWIESLLIPEGILIGLLCSQLHKARRAAEVANEAKSFFLANISHEMRTPLTAIKGFSELFANENDSIPADQKKLWIQSIQRNSHLLSRIIQDILDLSKVEAGALHLEKQSFEVKRLLREVEEILSPQAAHKNIKLNISVDQSVPEFIHSDPYRAQQILINLIGNSIKFTDVGSIKVAVQAVERKNSMLSFTIEDSGIGIPASEQMILFLPFSQVNRTLSRKSGGTGLGLVLSRKLAGLLGGDVRLIESLSGKGSTFVFEMTYEKVSTCEVKKLSEPHKIVPISFPRPISILLADDAPDNRMLLGHILTAAGAIVECTENGLEATQKAQLKSYDCLLIDLQMPVMDGYEATRTIRRRDIHTPIIALTAHGFQDERQKVLAAGFSGFLTKPVSSHELIEAIVNFL